MKFTNDELSKILTAHAAEGLTRGGRYDFTGYPCCIIQAAHEIGNINLLQVYLEELAPIVSWFDYHYEESWTVDQFLDQLVKQGVV